VFVALRIYEDRLISGLAWKVIIGVTAPLEHMRS